MSALDRILSLLEAGVALLGSARRAPAIEYCREPETRRWIARLDGHEAIADTRPEAARRVLWMRAKAGR